MVDNVHVLVLDLVEAVEEIELKIVPDGSAAMVSVGLLHTLTTIMSDVGAIVMDIQDKTEEYRIRLPRRSA
ncbi:hypothetical protein CHS0354_040765, partial [Potamilus streckersoni]